ncbi:MAG: hypothetical protein ABFD63_00875, partial [Smithella sp.]
ISALNSQHEQLNRDLNAAKEKQGWIRNNVLPDNDEVKALRNKIKKVEGEIASAQNELKTLTNGSEDPLLEDRIDNIKDAIINRIER